jgi:hypothetical protein
MMVSRLAQARPAVRPALKGRMMLSGPSGAGKTRSSLIIATELAEGGRILGIDTERESMLTYADDFDFDHLPWRAPYDVRELNVVLGEAGGSYAVVIVDSASHFWRKEGGVLDIANGKFTGWKEARPIQEQLVEAILDCGAHVILGVRSKVAHTQEEEKGRQVVKKLGMAPQQDDDLEFEMNVAIELAMDHTATISKSRTTALPVGRTFATNRTAEMARIYREWLKAGDAPAPAEVVDAIRARVAALPGELAKRCQDDFRATLCLPKYLSETQIPAAEALIAKYEAETSLLAVDHGGERVPERPSSGPTPQVQDSAPAGQGTLA